MILKRPNATIERGGYTAIVRKEGDLAIAEDFEGEKIKESENAASVIQAAIDSCSNAGKVVLADLFTTTAELTFPTAAWTSFSSGISLCGYGNKTGLNYTPATGYAIKMQGVSDTAPCCHHLLENFVISAPNTTGGGITAAGGVLQTVFRDVKIYNIHDGKGIYVAYNATPGNNKLRLQDVNIFDCKYGLYADGGPTLFISGGCFTTGSWTPTPGALEALYYTVTGYTSDGFKELYTSNLELRSLCADQRTMYVKGDSYFFTNTFTCMMT